MTTIDLIFSFRIAFILVWYQMIEDFSNNDLRGYHGMIE